MRWQARFKPGSHDEISISTSSETFDVHKRKHKKNATFVLLMFMLMHIKGSACLCLFHRVNQALHCKNRLVKNNQFELVVTDAL